MGDFLKLMIKELQNQDPLNPLENKDMLAQISQIRSVGATDKLTQTLDSVLLGQNIASATNLIGAQVSAISDEGERITGLVDSVSIDKGTPKLKVENPTGIVPSSAEDGNVERGLYSYRVVWEDANGNSIGMDFPKTIQTTGDEGVDKAIQISNLPTTSTQKQVFRTDKTGEGAYQLVGTIDGKNASFVDKLADSERSGTTLQRSFSRSTVSARTYDVSLNNVAEVHPPARPTTPTTPADDDEQDTDRTYRPPARTASL
jgi:flagellar hook assembly protein FlgD